MIVDRDSWKDIDLKMLRHPISKDVSALVGIKAVFQQLRIILSLSETDLPFHPDLGYNISDLLFDNFNIISKKTITRIIELAVQQHCKRVDLISVEMEWFNTRKELEISLLVQDRISKEQYTYKNTIRRIT